MPDASITVEYLLGTRRGRVAAQVLEADDLVAPELLDAEVLSVLRRAVLHGEVPAAVAASTLDRLVAWPVRRVPHAPLVQRAFALRANYSAYDALYVAVAELFQAPILTCDGRLSRAPSLAQVEIRNVR